MYRSIGAGLFILLSLLLLNTKAWADTARVRITADELNYQYDSKQIEALGHVKIEYKNVTIEAEQVILDEELNVLLAIGRVTVHNKEDIYQGDRFLYYLQTERGMISPLGSEIKDLAISGSVYLTAAEALIQGEELHSKNSSLTGCNLEHPHYRFTARELEYYPGDVIVMKHVWYWEHGVPIFYFPVFYISLKYDNFEITFGENDPEGWFIDANYYYYHPDQSSYGKINTRFTQYGGTYLEDDYSIKTSPTGVFTQKYGILNKGNMENATGYNHVNLNNSYDADQYYRGAEYGSPKDDYMVGFNYKENLNPKVVSEQEVSSFQHFTSIGDSYFDNRYKLTLTSQDPYPNLTLKYSDLGEQTYRNIDFRTNWQFNLDQTSSFSLNGHWVYLGPAADPDQSTLSKDYILNINKNWGWSNISIKASDYENLSNYYSQSNNKVPEIVYIIPDFKAPIMGDVAITTAYTHLEQFMAPNTVSSGERYGFNLHKLPIDLYHQGAVTVNADGEIWYRDFFIQQGTPDKMESELYAGKAELNLINQFTKELSATVSYGYMDTSGLKNSYFGYADDNVDPGNYIQNKWDWKSATLTANLTTGYNFQTQRADEVTMVADWVLDPAHREENLHFDTVYDWVLGWGQTNLNFNYNPKPGWLVQLGLSYNFQDPDNPWGRKSLLVQIQDRLTVNWDYMINAQWNDLYNRFEVAQAGLIYDWHCRKVEFSYGWLQKQFAALIYFKAFPNDGLRLTSTNTVGNLLSDMGNQ